MALPPTFSNRVRLQSGRVPDRQAAPNIIGQAATVLGRTIGQISDQNHEVDRQIAASQARIQEREIARDREVQDVEALARLRRMQAEREIAIRDIKENYTPGDDVKVAVAKLYDDTDSKFLETVNNDEQLRNKYRAQLEQDRFGATIDADAFMRVKRAEREAMANDDLATSWQMKQLAGGKIEAFDAAMVDLDDSLKNMTPATREKVRRMRGAQFAESTIDGYLQVRDFDGALKVINDGRFGTMLDPATAARAINKIQTQAAADARGRIDDFKTAARIEIEKVNSGVAVDPKQLTALAAQAEALGETGLAYDLREKAAPMAAVNDNFRNTPPLQIAEQMRALEQSDPEWRSKPQFVAAHRQMEKLIQENRQRIQNDVIGFFSANGGTVPPLDISDPASISARHSVALKAQRRYGGPLQVMSADEVKPLKLQFEQGSAADKAEIIENFMRAGNATGKAFMRQIAPAKPEYAWLTDLAGMRNGAAGRATMREALNGWEQLKADATVVQGENGTKMAQAFARLTGSAIPVDQAPARQAIMQVARGLYAARAQQAGVRDYDAKLWEASIRDASGAAPDGTGGLGVTRNSAAMLLPRGMTQGDVDITMARASGPNIVAAAGGNMPMWDVTRLKVGQLLDMQMEWAGDGLYRFRNASGKYVASSSNPKQPFTLDIRRLMLINRDSPAAPVAPAAPRAPALQGKGSAAANAALGGASLLQMLGISVPDKSAVKRDAAAALGSKK